MSYIPLDLDHKVDPIRKLIRVVWLLFHFHVFLLSLSINRCNKLDFFEFISIKGPVKLRSGWRDTTRTGFLFVEGTGMRKQGSL